MSSSESKLNANVSSSAVAPTIQELFEGAILLPSARNGIGFCDMTFRRRYN